MSEKLNKCFLIFANFRHVYKYIYIYIDIHACMCVCVALMQKVDLKKEGDEKGGIRGILG